jgi:imidazolonepropionase
MTAKDLRMGTQPLTKKLFRNATVATMRPDRGAYGLLTKGAIAVTGKVIDWVGQDSEITTSHASHQPIDLGGRLVTPGLIDCHTHLVFGGNRAREFEQRLQGASYEEIARSGGGIASTVKATREATEDSLVAQALPRLDAMIAEGVTTVEIKSGYGLDVDTELRMLRAARKLATLRPITVKTTFLGAHAIPPEFKGEPDRYIDEICIPALHRAHQEKLVDAVDGFCEGIAFTPAQIERVFGVAKSLGLPVKLHAEQLSNLGGAALAARYNALSCDHLEYLDQPGIDAMKRSNSVAVILPGAFYTLREKQAPPIEQLRAAGVAMAVSTDCNPGSSPMTSILLAMNMACTLFRMTPEETLAGATRSAAQALGLKDRGTLAQGQIANLAIWNIEHPSELAYRIGFNPLHQRIFEGELQ